MDDRLVTGAWATIGGYSTKESVSRSSEELASGSTQCRLGRSFWRGVQWLAFVPVPEINQLCKDKRVVSRTLLEASVCGPLATLLFSLR